MYAAKRIKKALHQGGRDQLAAYLNTLDTRHLASCVLFEDLAHTDLAGGCSFEVHPRDTLSANDMTTVFPEYPFRCDGTENELFEKPHSDLDGEQAWKDLVAKGASDELMQIYNRGIEKGYSPMIKLPRMDTVPVTSMGGATAAISSVPPKKTTYFNPTISNYPGIDSFAVVYSSCGVKVAAFQMYAGITAKKKEIKRLGDLLKEFEQARLLGPKDTIDLYMVIPAKHKRFAPKVTFTDGKAVQKRVRRWILEIPFVDEDIEART